MFSFSPRWKEELVCEGAGGSFVLELPMGVLSAYLPTEAAWTETGPPWARDLWPQLRTELEAWCDANDARLYIDATARVFEDSGARPRSTARFVRSVVVAGVNALAFAEWWFLGEALNAGDASGVYGTLYRVTGAIEFPMLMVVLAVDVGGVLWAIHAAATRSRSPFNRYVLLALVPWAIAFWLSRGSSDLPSGVHSEGLLLDLEYRQS
jgi:hypothetical protein